MPPTPVLPQDSPHSMKENSAQTDDTRLVTGPELCWVCDPGMDGCSSGFIAG
jgi:hypothetical protein